MRFLLLGVACFTAHAATAQKTVPLAEAASGGGCDTGSARTFISVADVQAPLYNTGALFWRSSGDYRYEVPAGSGARAIFAANLWVSGEVEDGVRFAGTTYGPTEFWPGALGADGAITPTECAASDRIWSVEYTDLVRYEQRRAETPDLVTWPIAQGAPFYVDANRNSRRDADEPRLALDLGDDGYSTTVGAGRQIDLVAGERPDIVGDQGLWWVMNDAGGPHAWSESEPLGIEVQVLAYAFDSGDAAIAQSTFYEYTVINRSAATITDSRVSLFVDADLGDYQDDYVSSDSSRGLAIVYNGDETDAIASGGYGDSPPALGVDFLNAAGGVIVPLATGGGSVGEPVPGDDLSLVGRRLQQSIWKDGTPLTAGGYGYNPASTDVTRWSFDGDPVAHAFWTLEQPTPNGAPGVPLDQRVLVNSTPETLAPGARRQVDIAILFAEGGPLASDPSRLRSRLTNVARLRTISDAVQTAYDATGATGLGEVSVQYDAPSAPAQPSLIAPANGTDFDAAGGPDNVTCEWAPVGGADSYEIELATDAAFDSTRIVRYATDATLTIPATDLPPNAAATYWRVLASNQGVRSAPSETRQFTYRVFLPSFAAFETVRNADGPIAAAMGAAADFAGYPAPDGWRSIASAQQVTDGRAELSSPVFGEEAVWLISTGARATFDEFLERSVRSDNVSRLFPFDYEIRFTGTSIAYRRFQDDAAVEVPFELWNIGIGTPDDPSDDIRMIPVLLDIDEDGTFNLSEQDSPVSGGTDDPESDWIYWYNPVETSPGASGYLAYENGGDLDRSQVGEEVFARMSIVGWNMGTAPPYPLPYPEEGTIFRIRTTNPFGVAAEDDRSPLALTLGVHPNPVAGQAAIPFTLADAADVRLSVVDVLGREVAVLAEGPRVAGEHRATWATGGLAAGVYVVVLRADGERATRTVTVVR